MIRAKMWIRHDGTVHESGDVFSAGEGDEKRLVALGAAEYVQDSGTKKPHNQKPDDPEDLEEETSIEEGNLPEIPEEDEDPTSREELEEEYRQLGGRPQADWTLEKLMTMLEERRGE